MALPENDIMSSYEPLIESIKHFRGPEAYILDTIQKVSSLPVKVKMPRVSNVADVARVISLINTNKL